MGDECYWTSLRVRIETRLAIFPCLEGWVVQTYITFGDTTIMSTSSLVRPTLLSVACGGVFF